MTSPRRPGPPPLETNDVRVVAIGTAAWAVAFFVLLPFYPHLQQDHKVWWLWVCVAGFVGGLIGLRYVIRRRARR